MKSKSCFLFFIVLMGSIVCSTACSTAASSKSSSANYNNPNSYDISASSEYKSDLGFTVRIPDHWLVLTRQEVSDNPDLFIDDYLGSIVSDRDFIESIEKVIKSGGVEFYLNRASANTDGVENISVSKIIDRLPQFEYQLDKYCSSYHSMIENLLSERMQLYQCKFMRVNGLKTVFIEIDGLYDNSRSMVWGIQKSPNIVVLFTATIGLKTLKQTRPEVEEIVNSVDLR